VSKKQNHAIYIAGFFYKLTIRKGGLRWFGSEDCKDDTDWVKCCTVMEVEGEK